MCAVWDRQKGILKGVWTLCLQCSDCAALTMESCVGEVFIEQGSPHEWVCTIIPSVCRLPAASFAALPGFLPAAVLHLRMLCVFMLAVVRPAEQDVFPWAPAVSSIYYSPPPSPHQSRLSPARCAPVKMCACCYFWCRAQHEFSLSRRLISRSTDGVMTWTSAQQSQNRNHLLSPRKFSHSTIARIQCL